MLRLLSLAAAFLTSLTTSHPAPHAPTAPPRPAVHGVAHPRVVATRPRPVSAPARPVLGGDVSWPNCPRSMGIPGRHGYALPMPIRSARYVVIGATNGPAFTRNPCIATQSLWARAHHLPMAAYAVIHYPTGSELRRYGGHGTTGQRLRRVGALQARAALATLRRAHVPTPIVWVDVETVGGHPWSHSAKANRALLSGVLAEYRRFHVRTGIYSYRSAWRQVMGGLRLRSFPTWVPSGGTTSAAALRKCRQPSFSGGRVLMTQWSVGSRDFDLTCPGVRPHGLFRAA